MWLPTRAKASRASSFVTHYLSCGLRNLLRVLLSQLRGRCMMLLYDMPLNEA